MGRSGKRNGRRVGDGVSVGSRSLHLMDLALIEKNVSELDIGAGGELIYALLAAYGSPKASLTRLRKGSLNKAKTPGDVLWKGKVSFRHVGTEADPHVVIDNMGDEPGVAKEAPRFLVVTTDAAIVAQDTKTGDTLDVTLDRLHLNAAFFMPWAGLEKAQLEAAHYADIKAAEKMARLHDEIRVANSAETPEQTHEINIFFIRLLFCLFAEDTGVLQPGSLTQSIARLTQPDGSDLSGFIARFFTVLDTPEDYRVDLPPHFAHLGYVNGALFAEETAVPELTAKARSILVECGELDWSGITPDIFGSMMQAVVHSEARAEAGMHYTSVDNILKVLRPLFLDSLEEDFESAGSDPKRLERLLQRVAAIRVFDPAAGSGNFLVVAYKELRGLEMRILERLHGTRRHTVGSGLFDVSHIELDHFMGIEIDDFAHEVARLSLWIAKHQTNQQFAARFAAFPPLIPIVDAGRIICANATRLDWADVFCLDADCETYICGNPPYKGAKMQIADQKADLRQYVADEQLSGNLDYVAIWLLKAADVVGAGKAMAAGLVATSSVCQGDHVGLLVPALLSRGVEFGFARRPFPWSNNARGNAGVSCIIVGLRSQGARQQCLLADGDSVRRVPHITPYLTAGASDTVVHSARTSVFGLPVILSGSMPRDGGHLLLERAELDDLLELAPEAERFVHPFMGADEFLSGRARYCLWVRDSEVAVANGIPPLAARFEEVRRFRERSKAPSTNHLAHHPHRFGQRAYAGSPSLVVPTTTSERRDYVPIGFVGPDVVLSNAMKSVSGAEPWLFGILQARMHMAWARVVSGRLENRLQYSIGNVYNTFPPPEMNEGMRASVTEAALTVLAARERFPDKTLADLYDPDHMPEVLRCAHRELDGVVDAAYRARPFDSDSERFDWLLGLYEARMAEMEAGHA